MSERNIPRVMLVGTGSGAGKTTITCAILQALKNRGLAASGFKCGPDYIDPMFHREVIGAPSFNLDLFLCGDQTVRFLLAKNAATADFSVIEGVMGMYDGSSFDSDECSSNQLALATDTPEILIINVRGMALSLGAVVEGFLKFRKNNLCGVILNGCGAGMYPAYRNLLKTLGVAAYGFFPQVKEAALESRHLGLVTAAEVQGLKEKLALLAQTAEESIDLDGLLALGKKAHPLSYTDLWAELPSHSGVKLAVAKDQAFCFQYQDNLDLLKTLGADLVFFSPLADHKLPPDVNGLILCGGYPEEYAGALAANSSMRNSIKTAVQHGLPTIAECGGFLYLLERLSDRLGNTYPMAGALKGSSHMTQRLSRFGYLTLTAKQDNLLCKAGETMRAHEFHYSDSDGGGQDMIAKKREKSWQCIHADDTIFAGYPHFHLAGNPMLAHRFLARCSQFTAR